MKCGITTAPRAVSHLANCLSSLTASGATDIRVCAEPGSDLSRCDGVKIIQRETKFGAWHNWLAMCRELLDTTDSEIILTVQDDVIFSADALTKLQEHWPEDTSQLGFISLYSPSHYQRKYAVKRGSKILRYFPDRTGAVKHAQRRNAVVEEMISRPGAARVKTKSLWGACALAFPRESLRRIIEHPIAQRWKGAGKRNLPPDRIANVDTAIGKICNALKLDMRFLTPAVAQHVGGESTLGHGGLGGRRQALIVADDLQHLTPPRRPTSPRPAAKLRSDAELIRELPCIHRGDKIRSDACNICGLKGQAFDVYQCKLHGDCSLQPRHTKVAACGRCRDRSPVVVSDIVDKPSVETPLVSIIVAARNNAPFLAEALNSARQQTIPCEVIYSDDCSTDDSVAIARQFTDTVLPSATHQGVCVTRNRGARVAVAPYLIFLDGDDILPPTFAEQHLAALAPETPFAYGPARIVGEGPMVGHIYPVPDWANYDRWRQNTVNTSAIWSRWAFTAAGGWRDCGSMWDWDLAIRAARFGEPQPSSATLDYRFHGASWSDSVNERGNGAADLMQKIRRLNVRLCVICIYSGRLPGLIADWCSRAAGSVRWANLAEPAEILVLDNSQNGEGQQLETELLRYADVFSSIRVIPHRYRYHFNTETERRDRVAEFLASACNRAVDLVRGDVLWFVEDDILVNRPDCDRLLTELTSGLSPPHAVSGAYRNRHNRNQFVGGHWRDNKGAADEFERLPAETTKITISGTGCLMFWKSRPLIPKFNSHLNHIPAHDWRWSHDLTHSGGELRLLPSVLCGHAVSESEVI